ncbi:MAG: respiratory nitrate reductase subunit gamma [Candidatus Hydrogenedentes bacterium]|nr:respiratory nitrate reductase subunit gamma [Candidatus Hydrogenedentota bacterium]MBI3119284.1 respiratory nitrate reductase subunit gamma [Candidatus Hydrogenedentota bacterium]
MLNVFLFAGLPYIALVTLVGGTIYRYRSNRFSYSALSSQFLEKKTLLWGSVPWHLGVFILLIGHLIPIFLPGLWRSLMVNQAFLLLVESAGIAAAILCLFGLSVALVRRLTVAKVQAVTSPMDLVVLGLLLFQVLLGLGVAMAHRWGAVWSTQTTTPYLWSLLLLQPNLDLVANLPPMVRLHLVSAFVLVLLVPFSRLVHMFSVPLAYLWRAPQIVIWNNPRRFREVPVVRQFVESRRYFLRGAFGLTAGGTLLTAGVMDKAVSFFRGPAMSPEEQAALLRKRLQRLEMTAEERELELERLRNNYIFVANLKELQPQAGKYFIDYQMRPALAFRTEDGLPLLISAKCTHLGCTVASAVDANKQLLCPCHMSYFDLHSGAPSPGSPALAPLPRLGWALMDAQGKLLLKEGPHGRREGEFNVAQLEECGVFICKEYEENA